MTVMPVTPHDENGLGQHYHRLEQTGRRSLQNFGDVVPVWQADQGSPVRTSDCIMHFQCIERKEVPVVADAHLLETAFMELVNNCKEMGGG